MTDSIENEKENTNFESFIENEKIKYTQFLETQTSAPNMSHSNGGGGK